MYNFHTSSIPVIIEFIHIYTIHTVHTEYFYMKKIPANNFYEEESSQLQPKLLSFHMKRTAANCIFTFVEIGKQLTVFSFLCKGFQPHVFPC